MKLRTTALAALVAAASPAAAHIHVHPEQAGAGQTVEISLQVGHGCAGAATTALRVALPEGLGGVLIAPKPGWQIATTGAGRVEEIRWTGGSLPNSAKESFSFVATLEGAGNLALPVVQVCGDTEIRWIEGPESAHPAPLLRVVPGS